MFLTHLGPALELHFFGNFSLLNITVVYCLLQTHAMTPSLLPCHRLTLLFLVKSLTRHLGSSRDYQEAKAPHKFYTDWVWKSK